MRLRSRGLPRSALRVVAVVVLAFVALAQAPTAFAHDGNVGFSEIRVDDRTIRYDLYLDARQLSNAIELSTNGDIAVPGSRDQLKLDGSKLQALLTDTIEVVNDGQTAKPTVAEVDGTSSTKLEHLGGVALLGDIPLLHVQLRYEFDTTVHDYAISYRLFLTEKGQVQHSNLVWLHENGKTRTFIFSPGGKPLLADANSQPDKREEQDLTSADNPFGGSDLSSLVNRTLDSPLTAGALWGMAFLFGCVHALGPGHGKSVLAAYVVGTRGRARDAIAVGIVVAAMHTLSVLIIGVGLWQAWESFAPERLFPWLSLASGIGVLAVGLWMCRKRFVKQHHGHGHTHELPDGVKPLSWPGLLALGASGGLLPSPSALVVLLGATAAGRIAFGLTLITAFSLGLAATLVVIGLSLVWGRDAVASRPRGRRLLALAPQASAVVLTALGLGLTISAFTQFG